MKINIEKKGFTLIELLVVVAIIGLLASVVLSSLNTVRNKANDASIKEEAHQLVSLLTLNYNDYGSYCNLQFGWTTINGACNAIFSGTYATQAAAICNNIVKLNGNYGSGYGGSGYSIYSNVGIASCATAYSFMIALNDGHWYCTGSSGVSAEYTSWGSPGDGTTPGCYNNP
jgi:prepilin-type N-terminal cleavage/methylation domain-containing protein